MPGHFTHIYSARRVADLLASGKFEDWPQRTDDHTNAHRKYDPAFCGEIMKRWEKFTAVGAIGPDLFYFSQDYNSFPLAPLSDNIMLAFATYYFFDAAKEDDWEPLLIILGEVNSESAALIRFLIKLNKIWKDFVKVYNETIGPLVSVAEDVLDDLTGGLISQFQVAVEEFKLAIKTIAEQELLTFIDIFNLFDTCVTKAWPEESFLWSDMSHYRGSSAMCQALVDQAEALRDGTDGSEERFEQFLAFSLGYMTHVGTDVIGHAWVNEQCGGPFRNHPQRHHVIENHIDAWNYKNSGFEPAENSNPIPNDPWGATGDYPDITMSALWFAVQLTPEEPHGKQRPTPLPDDPDARKEALDVDGEMPDWMANSIVLALMQAYADKPHPTIYGGSNFQATIDGGMLTDVIKTVTGHGIDRPIQELLDGIAPAPNFKKPVPQGFPLPWQIQTIYRIMITFYKLSYNGTWELQKPRKPDFIIFPPASDFTNLLQPPDFSGVNSSDPLEDVCAVIEALIEWASKELAAASQLAGDLIKMATSPGTYLLRLGLYELAMMVWDVVMKSHEVLAHTGYLSPHSEQRYDDGELRLPNEIDLPLITLGGTADSAFLQALDDAFDPFGNLDKDTNAIGTGHSVRDEKYPYYSVFRYKSTVKGIEKPPEAWEFHRPWAYPDKSRISINGADDVLFPTPGETYNPAASDVDTQQEIFKPLRAGPYPVGTRPDHVFFRTNVPPNRKARNDYENAQTPFQTDRLNEANLGNAQVPIDPAGNDMLYSPLGDIVPFSAYLIGRLVNNTGYQTNFNLDSDRGYAYLTWDWIRTDTREQEKKGLLTYFIPVVFPEGDDRWNLGFTPLELKYVDTAQQDENEPPPIK